MRLSIVIPAHNEEGSIEQTVTTLASTLDSIELSNACDWLADAADYYDVRLQERFGGTLAFAPPPASEHPADRPGDRAQAAVPDSDRSQAKMGG